MAGDALEAAVITMVLQGDAAVSERAGQVTSDLSSAERAGRSAERAAKSAEGSLGELANEITEVTHKLHLAVRVAERLAGAAGLNGPGLEAFGEGVSTFSIVNRVAAPLNAFLPGSSLVLGAAAGLFTGIETYEKKEAEEQKKADEQAERIAKKIAEQERKAGEKSVASELVRQAAGSLFSSMLGARTIQ